MPSPNPTPSHFIYILRCANNSYYVGQTQNLTQRLSDHNAGKASHHTRRHRPVSLVYVEGPLSSEAATLRELQLKGWSRKKKEKLIEPFGKGRAVVYVGKSIG